MRAGWRYIILGLLFILILSTCINKEQVSLGVKSTEQPKQPKQIDGDETLIEISSEGQEAAGIKTQILRAKSLPIYISAPGEVLPNNDLTALVTPRIQAQVVQRLVKVGTHVIKGQPLVSLSSVDMAKAQAELLLAQKEWARVKLLGKQAVSAKRYQTVEVAYQQAYSKLLAYGMTRAQIDEFVTSNDTNKANGEFVLLAQQSGTVFSADFTQGQMIAPGKILYTIVDETSLWVDAKLSNGDSGKIKKKYKGIIKTATHQFPAEVLQVHHQLDETTRTRIIRLKVANNNDQLHPGEFVTCLIQTGKTQSVLAVDQAALMQTPDGDLAVYIEVKPNYFRAQEVKVTQKIGSWRVIKGIKEGTRVVTGGAFFVHSESLKSGFSTHNH